MKKKAFAFILAFLTCFCALIAVHMSPMGDHVGLHVHATEDENDEGGSGSGNQESISPSALIFLSGGVSTTEAEVDHTAKTITFTITIRGNDISEKNGEITISDYPPHASRGSFTFKYDPAVFSLSSAEGQFMGVPTSQGVVDNDSSSGTLTIAQSSSGDDLVMTSQLVIVLSYAKTDITTLSEFSKKFSVSFESASPRYTSATYRKSVEFTAFICSHPGTHEESTVATCKDFAKILTVCDLCGKELGWRMKDGGKIGDHVYDYNNIKIVYDQSSYSTCKTSGVKMTCACRICGQWVEVKDLEYHKGLDASKLLYDPATKEFYYRCSNGHHVTARIQPSGIPEHTEHEWVETEHVDATCSSAGHITHTCIYGSETKTDDIPKLEHNFGDWTTVIEATCTEEGKEARTCSACGSVDERTVETTGHKFGQWVVTKPSTCVEEGVETRTCSVCDATEERTLAKGAHLFGEWETVSEASCTEAGKQERVCSVCHDEKEERAVEPLGHDFGIWQVTKEATCGEAGSMVRVCSRCSEKETREIPKDESSHNYVRKVVREASCYDDGVVEYICSICGNSDETRKETSPATGHRFTSSGSTKTCVHCGMAIERKDSSRNPTVTVKFDDFTLKVDISKSDPGDIWLKVEELSPDGDEYKLANGLVKEGHSIQKAYRVGLYINGKEAEFTDNMTLSVTLDQSLKDVPASVQYMPTLTSLEEVGGLSRNKLALSFPADSLKDAANDLLVIDVGGDKTNPGDDKKPSDEKGDYNIAVPIIIISVAIVATGVTLFAVLRAGKGRKIDF